jgi:Tol biopolymer transport system component
MGYTWSPDGNHIAAAAWVSGQSQILVISTVDGSFQMAASAGSDGYFYDLQWSPNGNAVIYVYTTWFGMFSIWRVDIDDEFDPVNLTEEHGDFSSSPVWSPDGGQIAYISRHEGVSNIWIMNADGARLAHITDY